MRLTTSDGRRIALQTWPLAYWPDGSVKWRGHAISAMPGVVGPLQLTPASANEERNRTSEIKYADDDDAFTIDTGAIAVR